MANYRFVTDVHFKPFTQEEMMKPFVMYKEAYDETEKAYTDLSDKTGDFDYLLKTMPEGSRARQLYEGYAGDLAKQAESLGNNGLTQKNRRALTSLKRRYKGEIGQLHTAKDALDKELELRRTANAKDSTMMYASNNLTLDDFLDGKRPNEYSVSGKELYTQAAQSAAAASQRVFTKSQLTNLNKYYQEYTQKMGISPESLQQFYQNVDTIPEYRQIIDRMMSEYNINGNLTGVNYNRARQFIISGLVDGTVYKEARSAQRNLGVMSASEADASKQGWARISLDRDKFNFEKQQYNDAKKAAAASGGSSNRSSNSSSGGSSSSSSGSSGKQDPRLNRAIRIQWYYDKDTKTWKKAYEKDVANLGEYKVDKPMNSYTGPQFFVNTKIPEEVRREARKAIGGDKVDSSNFRFHYTFGTHSLQIEPNSTTSLNMDNPNGSGNQSNNGGGDKYIDLTP